MSEVIQKIRVHTMELPLVKVFATSRRVYKSLIFCIAEVGSDQGQVGYGESREAPQITGEITESIKAVIEKKLAPALMGMNPFDIEQIHAAMEAEVCANHAAKCAVDLALYDLMGKIAGLPACRLMGGRGVKEVETSKAVGLSPQGSAVKEAASLVKQGFSTLKIKTGVDPLAEIKMIKDIRRAVGPAVRLKLDANQGWSLPEAVRVINAVEDCDIEVVEQPLPAWDYSGSARLRRLIRPPIMLDEGIKTPQDAVRVIETGAADMLNIKLLKCGGLYPAQAINSIAEAAGLVCQIGSLDTTIGTAAAAHLAMAKKNIRYAELVGPTRLKSDLASGLVIKKGMVRVPDGPGFGITVDTAKLK